MFLLYFRAGAGRWLLAGLLGLSAWASPGRAAAQAPVPTWQSALALSQDSASYSEVTASATDARGNVYVTGYFFGTARFDTIRLHDAGRFDVFVAKWDAALGTFAWAKRAGGSIYDYANAIAVLGNGVYIAGSFQDRATFGSIGLTGQYYDNSFVAKLTDAGTSATFDWAQTIVSSDNSTINQLAVVDHNVYVAGRFDTDARFGSIVLGNHNGGSGLFVAKLAETGGSASFQWAKEILAAHLTPVTGLAVVGNQVYLAGTIRGGALFGTLQLLTANYDTNAGFVAKLTDAGPTASFTWAQLVGGPAGTGLRAMAVRGTALYLAGSFRGGARFGTLPPPTVTGDQYDADAYVTKLTDTGPAATFDWVQTGGSKGNDDVTALAVLGNTVFVGSYYGDLAVFGNNVLFSRGRTDACVAALTDAGTSAAFTWVQSVGGADARITTLAPAADKLYVGDYFYASAQLGTYPIARPSYDPAGFLASLASGSPLATTQPVTPAALNLSPNPARQSVAVALPPGFGPGRPTLTLLDALGRVVRKAPAAPTPLDLTGLAPGVYLLRAVVGTQVAAGRLVIE